MSFLRHKQICQSDAMFKLRSEAVTGFAPGLIVLTSLQPAIPWRVGLHQSPPPLHQPVSIFRQPAETVNHHPAGAGEFSTGEMRNFHPALTYSAPPPRQQGLRVDYSLGNGHVHAAPLLPIRRLNMHVLFWGALSTWGWRPERPCPGSISASGPEAYAPLGYT